MNGHASDLDLRVQGATVMGAAGPVEIEDARVYGSGMVSMQDDRMSFLSGTLAGVARLQADEVQATDLLPGYLENIDMDDATATVRFDLSHVDEITQREGAPLVITGAQGRVAGDVSIENIDADVSAQPFDRGLSPGREGL